MDERKCLPPLEIFSDLPPIQAGRSKKIPPLQSMRGRGKGDTIQIQLQDTNMLFVAHTMLLYTIFVFL